MGVDHTDIQDEETKADPIKPRELAEFTEKYLPNSVIYSRMSPEKIFDAIILNLSEENINLELDQNKW